jgi:hypothetical protein
MIDVIAAAVNAIALDLPTGFSWLGRSSPPLTPSLARALSPDDMSAYLTGSLTDRLYRDFFVCGWPRPWSEDRVLDALDPDFTQGLIAANNGSGPWVPGWRITSKEPDSVLIFRDGLTLSAPARDCRPIIPGDPLAVGAAVDVHLPSALPGRSAGYYLVLGDVPLPADDGARTARLYWNVAPDGAAPLMRAITETLNRRRISFQFKILNNPDSYDRCDSAVLYVKPSAVLTKQAALREIYETVAIHMRDGVPALTLQIARGLGVADGPPDGASFGMQRCQLIAEGLVGAESRGFPEERVDSVLETFRNAGVDPGRPYLNPKSASRFEPWDC